jgi:phosphatidylinositol-3-phosphatase
MSPSSTTTRFEPLESRTLFAFGIPTPDHVVVVIESTRSPEDIVGNTTNAPYLNSLIDEGRLFNQSFGVAGPSQANFLALFSGSPQRVEDDLTLANAGNKANLAKQLFDTGREFIQYSEDLPRVGFKGASSGDYTRLHNPVAAFSNLPKYINRPFSDFPSDFTQLADVSFVIPDQTHNMGDGSVRAGDDWLRDNLGDYATWAETHNSLLIVTFDRGQTDSFNNRIPTLFFGPMVEPGTSDQAITHYSVLRTIEEMYGLSALNQAATADPITDIWDQAAAGPDTTPPEVASFTARRLRSKGLKYYTFTVTYSDNVAVVPGSMDDNDITVTGPNGFSRHAELVRVNRSSSAPARTATYRVKAPGGSRWTDDANGVYTITLNANQVSDTNGNTADAGEIGKFTVIILGEVGRIDTPFSLLPIKSEQPEHDDEEAVFA